MKVVESKPLRTAVVGLGRIGWQFHVPQILKHPGFELAAVVDPLPERLTEFGAKFGDARCYTSLDELLANEALDLVVIASPTAYHAPQAIAAFERGIDVFCDKPIGLNLADCDAMIASMEAHKCKLMVYQPHRVTSEVVALQDILRRGILGEIYMMKAATSTFSRRNDWQAWTKNGGGMLANYGAHFMDQLLYIAGSGTEKVSCLLRTMASLGDADDVVKAVVETHSGMIIDLDINMCAGIRLPRWMVFGKHGTASLDRNGRVWDVRYFREEEMPAISQQEGLAASGRSYCVESELPWHEEAVSLDDFEPIDFYAQCHAFYADDADPLVPIAETRELMRTLELCRNDAANNG